MGKVQSALASSGLQLVGSAAASVAVALLFFQLRLCSTHSGGPRMKWSWFPFIGEAISFGKDPIRFMLNLAAESRGDEGS